MKIKFLYNKNKKVFRKKKLNQAKKSENTVKARPKPVPSKK
jgi:hypothetical protein